METRLCVSIEDLDRIRWCQTFPRVIELLRYHRFLPLYWKKLDQQYEELVVKQSNHLTNYHLHNLTASSDCYRCVELTNLFEENLKACNRTAEKSKKAKEELRQYKCKYGIVYRTLKKFEPFVPTREADIDYLKDLAAKEARIDAEKRRVNDEIVQRFAYLSKDQGSSGTTAPTTISDVSENSPDDTEETGQNHSLVSRVPSDCVVA